MKDNYKQMEDHNRTLEGNYDPDNPMELILFDLENEFYRIDEIPSKVIINAILGNGIDEELVDRVTIHLKKIPTENQMCRLLKFIEIPAPTWPISCLFYVEDNDLDMRCTEMVESLLTEGIDQLQLTRLYFTMVMMRDQRRVKRSLMFGVGIASVSVLINIISIIRSVVKRSKQ